VCVCVCIYIPTYIYRCLRRIRLRPKLRNSTETIKCSNHLVRGKWRELESRFQLRFPGIDSHCQSARFFLLALILILTLYSHGYRYGSDSKCLRRIRLRLKLAN